MMYLRLGLQLLTARDAIGLLDIKQRIVSQDYDIGKDGV